MRKHVLKATLLVLLGSAILTAPATAQNSQYSNQGPELEELEVVPGDVSHGEDVYVGVKATSSSSVEDVWFTVRSDGDQVFRKVLWDSNNDNYYASPVSFEVTGGNTYTVEVNACDRNGECSSVTETVRAECELGAMGRCIY